MSYRRVYTPYGGARNGRIDFMNASPVARVLLALIVRRKTGKRLRRRWLRQLIEAGRATPTPTRA